ncbi:MAG: hypothetical protein M1305_02690, partial [Candidatus Marsarchaeota archaeon]|nr:hypothetical protein [Candidatus Marsarchaeota archaeon]
MSKELSRLIEDLTKQRLTRRQFMTRAAALGLSMGAIGTILAACGGSSTPAPTETATSSGTESATAAATETANAAATETASATATQASTTGQKKQPNNGSKFRLAVI